MSNSTDNSTVASNVQLVNLVLSIACTLTYFCVRLVNAKNYEYCKKNYYSIGFKTIYYKHMIDFCF